MRVDAVDSFLNVLRAEAAALEALAEYVDPEEVARAIDLLLPAATICVTGMGKSGHIARKVASTMSSLGRRAIFVHPAEAAHGDLGMIGGDDVILAFSWSGDTAELAPIIAESWPIVAVTSRCYSKLGVAAGVVIELPPLAEACVNGQAPTTSTTMQLAVGDALAVALSVEGRFTADMFRRLHPGGALGHG